MQIPIEYEREKIDEGWINKGKGLLQILWERGFIDLSLSSKEIMKKYSVSGKKDDNNNIIEGTSLKDIIMNLPDFKQEKTLLQYWAEEMGVRIECSPKYHPKIAGEGIKFCWGLAKNFYCAKCLEEKKRELVETGEGMYLQPISDYNCKLRRFGRRICRYMLAYLGIEHAKTKQVDGSLTQFYEFDLKVPEMSLQLVERLVKVYKSPRQCHHNILDSEKKFLISVVGWIKTGTIEEELEEWEVMEVQTQKK